MAQRIDGIRQLGADVLVISFAEPKSLKPYLADSSLPFPILADPSRAAYQAFGLGKTSWRKIFSPVVVSRYLKLMFRGWMPRKSSEEDMLQLGGDFVLDKERRLIYAHRSKEPTDRPTVDELISAIKSM